MREGVALADVASQLGVAPERLERILIAFGRRRAALLAADMDGGLRHGRTLRS